VIRPGHLRTNVHSLGRGCGDRGRRPQTLARRWRVVQRPRASRAWAACVFTGNAPTTPEVPIPRQVYTWPSGTPTRPAAHPARRTGRQHGRQPRLASCPLSGPGSAVGHSKPTHIDLGERSMKVSGYLTAAVLTLQLTATSRSWLLKATDLSMAPAGVAGFGSGRSTARATLPRHDHRPTRDHHGNDRGGRRTDRLVSPVSRGTIRRGAPANGVLTAATDQGGHRSVRAGLLKPTSCPKRAIRQIRTSWVTPGVGSRQEQSCRVSCGDCRGRIRAGCTRGR
jgi:hypothetical protein